MPLKLKQFLTLAGMTAAEIIRQPICLILTTSCVVLTSMIPIMIMHQLGEEGKLVRDSALAFHMVFGMLISAFASSRTLSSEIVSGTASAVLSKPVSRETFYLAKYCGVAGALLLFSVCATLSGLLSSKVMITRYEINWAAVSVQMAVPAAAFAIGAIANYRYMRPFSASSWISIGLLLIICMLLRWAMMDTPSWSALAEWRLIPAAILITLALLMMSSITLALATLFNVMPTVALSSIVFILGLVSYYYFGRFADDHILAAILYALLPNWHHFWLSDVLNGGGVIPFAYVAHAASYALLYGLGMIGLGMYVFRQREIS
jgi:ABC-type transport system involved in multi-copper enzyme maturation permease subunit